MISRKYGVYIVGIFNLGSVMILKHFADEMTQRKKLAVLFLFYMVRYFIFILK